MARLRIRAKAQPERTGPSDHPLAINGYMLSWTDVEVFIVQPDGSELPFPKVKRLALDWAAGDDVLTATIEVYDLELDIDVVGDEVG